MARMTPLVRVVPTFETGPIPWIPQSEWPTPTRFAVKIEPNWDSCYGREGTFGWAAAIIRVGFPWAGTELGLSTLLNERLSARGWVRSAAPSWASVASDGWSFPKGAAPSMAVAFQRDSAGGETVFLQAKPKGQVVTGC